MEHSAPPVGALPPWPGWPPDPRDGGDGLSSQGLDPAPPPVAEVERWPGRPPAAGDEARVRALALQASDASTLTESIEGLESIPWTFRG